MAATTERFTYAENTTLEVRVCPTCGVTYALPARLTESHKEQGSMWYCPNGHRVGFVKSAADEAREEASKLRKKLEDEKANAEWWRKRSAKAEEETEHERSRANGYKGALTKVKKRVGNGVCPCCNRSFADLHRHMASKHPDFSEPGA